MPADRDLLLGLLALQTGLIDHTALMAAFHAWSRDKARPLADQLVALGYLDAAHRPLLEGLAAAHIARHDGDVERSLADIPAGRSTRESLAGIADAEIAASIGHLGAASTHAGDDADRTASYSVGTATSDGLRFRVLRPHARGGLGAVFVALDSELHREVALKQMHDSHADDPSSRHRFVAEAEITGGLEHPGVVPVYGLGTYGSGRPYYAMRFIKGESFKEAIERFHQRTHMQTLSPIVGEGQGGETGGSRDLELRKLLRRFTDVCNAVDYAHSRGVIHRDLKPANIILGRHGETLVVDWGLAKSIGRADPSVGEQTIAPSSGGSSETLPGSALGTPPYMSPEQAAGDLDQLGPRSDVYSLGATLYCLLTGNPPFQGDDIGEILRRVQAGDFRAPREVDPSLDKALEAVCLKAMATKPEDRYASGRALAEDVERWAADEAVTAYPEPWTRTLVRWLTRHRTGVTAAAAALLVGLMGLGSVAAVQTRARNDLDRKNGELTVANARVTKANAELTQANIDLDFQRRRALANETEAISAVKRFRDAVANEPELKNTPQLESLRRSLLKEPLAFFKALRNRLQADKDTGPESLERLAAASFDLGKLTDEIGDKQDAAIVYQDSLSIYQKLAETNPAVADYQVRLGNAHIGIGDALWRVRLAEALKAVDSAIAIFQKLADANPAVTEYQSRLAYCHNRRGALVHGMGRMLAESEAEFRKALAIREKLAEENPGVTQFVSDLASSHYNLGANLRDTGKWAAAEAEYRSAIALRQKLADDNPSVAEFRNDLALVRGRFGEVLGQIGRLGEAEAEYRLAIALHRKVVDDNPAVTDYRFRMAWSYYLFGNLLRSMGRAAEAEAGYRNGLALYQKLADDNPAVTDFRNGLALGHGYIGDVARSLGRAAEARDSTERAIVLCQRLVQEDPTTTSWRYDLAWSLRLRGEARRDLGDPAGAAADLRRAVALYDGLSPRADWELFDTACGHAALSSLAGRNGTGVSAAEGQTEVARAMGALTQAASMGDQDANALRTEPALDPLRSRDDFRVVMMDMAFPAEPFAAAR
jgi:serine/threonine-protein kinase